MNIMIIDDDEEDASFFSDAIKDIAPHIRCHIALSCEVAKTFLNDSTAAPSFIFLDAYMYPQGGRECLIQLSTIDKLTDSKIIIHSGALSQQQINDFMALGADAVMVKPKNYETLCKNLSEFFDSGE